MNMVNQLPLFEVCLQQLEYFPLDSHWCELYQGSLKPYFVKCCLDINHTSQLRFRLFWLHLNQGYNVVQHWWSWRNLSWALTCRLLVTAAWLPTPPITLLMVKRSLVIMVIIRIGFSCFFFNTEYIPNCCQMQGCNCAKTSRQEALLYKSSAILLECCLVLYPVLPA